jgi:hypothetical protein
MQDDHCDLVDDKLITDAVERALGIYLLMGMRGDQAQRASVKVDLSQRIKDLVEGGERDRERLQVGGLKHLCEREDRPRVRGH